MSISGESIYFIIILEFCDATFFWVDAFFGNAARVKKECDCQSIRDVFG